jgi:hypothetical protein
LTGRRPPTRGAVSIAASSAGISSIRRTNSPSTAPPPNGVSVGSSARIITRGACRNRPARARSATRRARRLAFALFFTDKVRPPRSTANQRTARCQANRTDRRARTMTDYSEIKV